MFADKLGDHIVQSVMDLLFEQLSLLVESSNKLMSLRGSGNPSEVSLDQRSQELKQSETALCYFIAFLRRVAVTQVAQHKLVSGPWIDLLKDIISFRSKGKESHFSLRTRMLTLHLLTFILPACEDSILIKTVSVNGICSPLSHPHTCSMTNAWSWFKLVFEPL